MRNAGQDVNKNQLQSQYGVMKSFVALQAERLLKEYPELAAEVKDGTRQLPRNPGDWETLKKKSAKSEPKKSEPEPEADTEGTAPIEAAAPTPSVKPLLIPFDPPGGSPLEPHPLAAPFPLIEGEEFAELL
jgi:hypothetical protein